MSSGVSEPSYFGVMFIWLDFFYVLFKVTTSPVFCLFKLKHLRRVFCCNECKVFFLRTELLLCDLIYPTSCALFKVWVI